MELANIDLEHLIDGLRAELFHQRGKLEDVRSSVDAARSPAADARAWIELHAVRWGTLYATPVKYVPELHPVLTVCFQPLVARQCAI